MDSRVRGAHTQRKRRIVCKPIVLRHLPQIEDISDEKNIVMMSKQLMSFVRPLNPQCNKYVTLTLHD
jgi:hypothetical protein